MEYDFSRLAVPGVTGIQPYVPGRSIEELAREQGIEDIIKLASNENPLGHSQAVYDVLAKIKDLARYPDGEGVALKTVLAEFHQLEPSQITLGNGSNDLLELVARVFVPASGKIVYSDHAFAVYALVTQAIGATHTVVPIKNWRHDLVEMAVAVDENTQLMFIANPNNPTGTWNDQAALERLLEIVPTEVIVVLDEAYYEYAAHLSGYPQSVPLLKRYPNLVITRTFSKAYGLAGLRVGYALSNPSIADLMNRVRQPFNVNSVAQASALAAFSDYAHIKKAVQLNEEGMKQLCDEFSQLDLPFIPSAGNFICVKFNQAELVYQELLQKGVIIRTLNNYGLPDYLRITVGLESENTRLLDTLTQILSR